MDMKLASLSPVRELKVRTNGGGSGSSVVSATMTWTPPVGRLSPTTNTVSILEQPENHASTGAPTNGYKRHRQPTPTTTAALAQNESSGSCGGTALEFGLGLNLGFAKEGPTANDAGQLVVGDDIEGSASEVVPEAAPVESADVEVCEAEARDVQCSEDDEDDEDSGHLMIAVGSDGGVPLSLSPLPNTVIGITCPEAGLEIRDN